MPAKRGELAKFMDDLISADRVTNCIVWPFARTLNGRALYKNARLGFNLASRVVCERKHGKPPTPKHEAAHSCGNGHEGCINPDHLSWKTRTENQADRLVHGTDNRGSRHGMSKLNDDQVREIRALRGIMKHAQIAKMFGISSSYVSQIQTRKFWDWLN